jgi:hypothetical protein
MPERLRYKIPEFKQAFFRKIPDFIWVDFRKIPDFEVLNSLISRGDKFG